MSDQKFKKGDIAVVLTGHLLSDADGTFDMCPDQVGRLVKIVGSYDDLYGGGDQKNYQVRFLDTGETTSWKHENQLRPATPDEINRSIAVKNIPPYLRDAITDLQAQKEHEAHRINLREMVNPGAKWPWYHNTGLDHHHPDAFVRAHEVSSYQWLHVFAGTHPEWLSELSEMPGFRVIYRDGTQQWVPKNLFVASHERLSPGYVLSLRIPL